MEESARSAPGKTLGETVGMELAHQDQKGPGWGFVMYSREYQNQTYGLRNILARK